MNELGNASHMGTIQEFNLEQLLVNESGEHLAPVDDSRVQSGTTPCFYGSMSHVTDSVERFGFTIQVHELGPRVGSTSVGEGGGGREAGGVPVGGRG